MALGCAWTGLVADDAAALCVAGVAQGDIHLRCRHFAWQAWHFGDIHLRFAWQAWHLWHWMARLDRIICDVQCLVLYAETWRLGNACDIGVFDLALAS